MPRRMLPRSIRSDANPVDEGRRNAISAAVNGMAIPAHAIVIRDVTIGPVATVDVPHGLGHDRI